MTNVSERAQALLRSLVEHYIRDGQPVASKTLADTTELSLSPATIRSVLANLEERGYLVSPHTSAGRIPTAQGYRVFVDGLLMTTDIDAHIVAQLSQQLDPTLNTQELIGSATNLVSDLTKLAGLVSLPKREQVSLRHVEFLPLSDNRILVILVLNEKEIQNRIIYTDNVYSVSDLEQAANFLNAHYAGKSLTDIRQQVLLAMRQDKQRMDNMMQMALHTVEQALAQAQQDEIKMAGELNLLNLAQAAGMDTLRDLFDAFSQKQVLLHLLDKSLAAEEVQLFIGEEAGYDVLASCSVITAPYRENGQVIGVVGVIGPTRMDYERVIPIVDLTAKLMSAALNSGKSSPY